MCNKLTLQLDGLSHFRGQPFVTYKEDVLWSKALIEKLFW